MECNGPFERDDTPTEEVWLALAARAADGETDDSSPTDRLLGRSRGDKT